MVNFLRFLGPMAALLRNACAPPANTMAVSDVPIDPVYALPVSEQTGALQVRYNTLDQRSEAGVASSDRLL